MASGRGIVEPVSTYKVVQLTCGGVSEGCLIFRLTTVSVINNIMTESNGDDSMTQLTNHTMSDLVELSVVSTSDIAGYKSVQMHNPTLIGIVMAVRMERRLIQSVNERKWG